MLLDLSHTSHTRARTGIQRVALALWKELGAEALPICRDPYLGSWRPLEAWELANLTAESAAGNRRARWPLRTRIRGWWTRLAARGTGFQPVFSIEHGLKAHATSEGLLIPEFFSPAVAAALPSLFAAVPGPRAALFFDAIALKYPELTPARTVARYPAYLRDLLEFDGIAAISEDSRDTLIDYWKWLGVKNAPPVAVIPLGVDAANEKWHGPAARDRVLDDMGWKAHATINPPLPSVLSVGSIEGRKNHLALLDACERLWADGLHFELRLIGMVHPQTGRAAVEKIAALQRAGRTLRHDGTANDAALARAYADSAFTVYPSLMEGFGLPVSESLTYGKPCVCSGRGALGEIARGGGCVALDAVDPTSLAAAIRRLLTGPNELAALSAAAAARRFKSWSDYARELTDWMAGLSVARSRTAGP